MASNFALNTGFCGICVALLQLQTKRIIVDADGEIIKYKPHSPFVFLYPSNGEDRVPLVGVRDRSPWGHNRTEIRTRQGYTPRRVFAFAAI